jgi:hypothetical protein
VRQRCGGQDLRGCAHLEAGDSVGDELGVVLEARGVGDAYRLVIAHGLVALVPIRHLRGVRGQRPSVAPQITPPRAERRTCFILSPLDRLCHSWREPAAQNRLVVLRILDERQSLPGRAASIGWPRGKSSASDLLDFDHEL